MIEAFFIVMMLMVRLTLGEGDPDTPAALTQLSETAVAEDSPGGRSAFHPCTSQSPQWQDLSQPDFVANPDGSHGEGTPDEI